MPRLTFVAPARWWRCAFASVLAISMPSAQAASGRCRATSTRQGHPRRGPNLQVSRGGEPVRDPRGSQAAQRTPGEQGPHLPGSHRRGVPLPTLDAHHQGVVLTAPAGLVDRRSADRRQGPQRSVEDRGSRNPPGDDSAIRNTVLYGGGIFAQARCVGSLRWSPTTPHGSRCEVAAGTMLVRDLSTVHDNVARRGGGIFAEERAHARDQASVSANYGRSSAVASSVSARSDANTSGQGSTEANIGGVYNQDVSMDDATITAATRRPSRARSSIEARAAGPCSATIVLSPNSPEILLRSVSHGLMSSRLHRPQSRVRLGASEVMGA